MTTAQPTGVSATTPATGMLDAPTILKSEAVSTVEPARFPAKASKWSQRLSFESLPAKPLNGRPCENMLLKRLQRLHPEILPQKVWGGRGGASERSLLVGVQ